MYDSQLKAYHLKNTLLISTKVSETAIAVEVNTLMTISKIRQACKHRAINIFSWQ